VVHGAKSAAKCAGTLGSALPIGNGLLRPHVVLCAIAGSFKSNRHAMPWGDGRIANLCRPWKIPFEPGSFEEARRAARCPIEFRSLGRPGNRSAIGARKFVSQNEAGNESLAETSCGRPT
jgi:hypothetical protein